MGSNPSDRASLERELARLEGEITGLSHEIMRLARIAENQEASVKENRWNVGLSTLTTIGGLAAGIATPFALVVSFVGIGLLYRSGYNCFRDGAALDELRLELARCKDRLAVLRKRADEIVVQLGG